MTKDGSAESGFKLPKASRLILMDSARDRLELRERSEFSWIYLVTMIVIVGAFVGMEIGGHARVEPGRSDLR